MKRKYICSALTAVCVLALLPLTAAAKAPSYLLEVTAQAGEVAKNFFTLLLNAFYSFSDIYFAFFQKIPLLSGLSFLPVVILLLIASLFGCRLYRLFSIICGAVIGFAAGYALYDLLLAWVNSPIWVSSLAHILRWVVALVVALLGILLAILLRRIGMALLLSLGATVLMAQYTSHTLFLLAVLVLAFVLSFCMMKNLIIHVSSIGGSLALVKVLFSSTGRFPLNLSAYLGITRFDAWILVGLVLGVICMSIQLRMNRGRRCC